MADAKKCDICGSFFELTDNARDIDRIVFSNQEFDHLSSAPPIHFDICSDCRRTLADLILQRRGPIVSDIEEVYCSKCDHQRISPLCEECLRELNTLVGYRKPYHYK